QKIMQSDLKNQHIYTHATLSDITQTLVLFQQTKPNQTKPNQTKPNTIKSAEKIWNFCFSLGNSYECNYVLQQRAITEFHY
ncbi:hypothetical protein DVQ78_21465, partial [Yersinia enterocolitica]|nr:hypothetical protein [Yersinia enterocolitica]